jgi:hypothetical protein
MHDLGDCWWPRFDAVLAASTATARQQLNLTDAIGFLEQNTGIRSGLKGSYGGYLIDRGVLRKSFNRWLRWFVDRYPYLYWDAQTNRFAVDASAQERRVTTTRPRVPADGDCQTDQPKLDDGDRVPKP